ncbi:MAG: aldo/keto reductase [Chloroflexota bacterium]|nr:aldo/keto reductase [Chloroflexota bacterium]
MEYSTFGSAGVKVSRLALGLGLRGQADEAAAQRLVEHAIDQGINLLDCANIYGPLDDRAHVGRSEVVLGRAIQGKRDRVVITSKVAAAMGSGPNDRGLSRYHILREIEGTLRRLATDHVDVYLAHSYDHTTPLEETVRALDDIVRSGKARYIGCCNYAAWQVCRALWVADTANAAPYMCVQNPYSLLDRRLEGEMFGLVRDRGLGLMAYSPLAVGLLSGRYQPGQPPPDGSLWATRLRDRYASTMQGAGAEVVRTVQAIAAEVGKTPAQIAVAWILAHPEVTCVISGADTPEQFDDVRGAVGWELPPELRHRLDTVSTLPSTLME